MTYYPCRSTIIQNFSTIAQTVYEIYVTKDFHFLAPGGLTPGPKFTKSGEDLADSDIYHPAKFHRSMPTHAGDIRYKNPADKETNKKTNSKRYIHISYRHVWIIIWQFLSRRNMDAITRARTSWLIHTTDADKTDTFSCPCRRCEQAISVWKRHRSAQF